jgi:heme/copper-type cytochrome/quinol oxidase subunit 2
MMLWVVGMITAAVAVWQFYLFVMFRDSRGALDAQGGGGNLWLAIGAAAAACVCVCIGIFGRINRTEEFHITS